MNINAYTGRITETPELKTTTSGVLVTTFTLAVKRPHAKDVTDFINFVAWRQSAEYLCKYAQKGNRVSVTGYLTSRKFEDSNGNKRTAYEVVCDSVEIIESRQSTTEQTAQAEQTSYNPYDGAKLEAVDLDDDDSLPF